jgi:hypothetical protein
VDGVKITVSGSSCVCLDQAEARALVDSLWRVGEFENVRHAISLSAALRGSHKNIPVIVEPTQVAALRHALDRLATRAALTLGLGSLSEIVSAATR